MKKNNLLISLLTIIFIILCGCEKDDPPKGFVVRIILVNEFGKQTSSFEEGDSLIFEFYLTNHTGSDAEYLRPCSEFGHFLKVYKENPEGIYQYIGQPEYVCALVAVYLSIKNDETILLTRVPWSKEIGCPEIKSGKYYVGDTLKLKINSERYNFTERIYFEIL